MVFGLLKWWPQYVRKLHTSDFDRNGRIKLALLQVLFQKFTSSTRPGIICRAFKVLYWRLMKSPESLLATTRWTWPKSGMTINYQEERRRKQKVRSSVKLQGDIINTLQQLYTRHSESTVHYHQRRELCRQKSRLWQTLHHVPSFSLPHLCTSPLNPSHLLVIWIGTHLAWQRVNKTAGYLSYVIFTRAVPACDT